MKYKIWIWWTLVNAGVAALLYAQYKVDLYHFVVEKDASGITFGIAGVTVFAIVAMWLVRNDIGGRYNQMLWFCSDMLQALGMIGTLIGLLMVLGKAFTDVDVSNVDSMRDVISFMSVGMSTAFITTLAGLTTSVWIKAQLVVLES